MSLYDYEHELRELRKKIPVIPLDRQKIIAKSLPFSEFLGSVQVDYVSSFCGNYIDVEIFPLATLRNPTWKTLKDARTSMHEAHHSGEFERRLKKLVGSPDDSPFKSMWKIHKSYTKNKP